jgi:hypothetical protein
MEPALKWAPQLPVDLLQAAKDRNRETGQEAEIVVADNNLDVERSIGLSKVEWRYPGRLFRDE